MRLLSVDPSSTCTGWATWDDGVLLRAGTIRPPQAWAYERRADRIVESLLRVVDEHGPHLAILERPSGRQGKGTANGAKAQLAIYGMAVGEVRRALLLSIPAACVGAVHSPCVLTTDEREWTRGQSLKTRRLVAAAEHPTFKRALEEDEGGDLVDGICIGEWFWTEERKRRAVLRAEGGAHHGAGSVTG